MGINQQILIMKYVFLTIVLFVCVNMNAQIESKHKDVFIRVYNLDGKKIAKGKILIITEKSIILMRRGERIEVVLDDIGKIRTKHSFGNNILTGAAIGGASFALLGVASASDSSSYLSHSAPQGALIGTILGGFFGSIVGTLTGLFKNSKVYKINGDATKLESFKNLTLENNE